MAEPLRDPMTFPVRRSRPFDPPEEYRRLRTECPVSPLRLPGGKIGWLVTRYDDVRAVVADSRFTPPLNQVAPVEQLPLTDEELRVPPGTFSALDSPEHAKYRKLVTTPFTVRGIREFTPRIERIVGEHLTAMMHSGAPADLFEAFAMPISLSAMSELLGVPAADRAQFKDATLTMFSLASTPDQLRAASDRLYQGMREIVQAKQEPADDLLARLVYDDNGLIDEEVVNIGALLLIAGLAMTAHMLALGTFALLQHPDQLAALRADPSLMDQAIEELLRYLSIVQWGLTRTAREDLTIGDHHICAGETVIASLAAANRDPRTFPDPDRLILSRAQNPHLAFGHGVHHCLGAQLGREIMKVGFGALLSRLPTLRLAVPADQISRGEDMVFYGVHTLPVSWDPE